MKIPYFLSYSHFASAFSKRLVGRDIPAWVNRAASFGSSLLPKVKPTVQEKPKPTKAEQKAKEAEKNQRPELSEKQKALLAKMKKGSKS